MAIAEVKVVEPVEATPEEDFHPAVRLLLRRMETDPQEFVGSTRWEKVMASCRDLATTEERNVLFEKYRCIQMDAVHVEAMKIITHANEPDNSPADMPTNLNDLMQSKEAAMALHTLRAEQAMKRSQAMQAQQAQDQEWERRLNQMGSAQGQVMGIAQQAMNSARQMPTVDEMQARGLLSKLSDGWGGYTDPLANAVRNIIKPKDVI